MNVNGKMRPIKTVPGMGARWIKKNDGGVNSSMIYLIYCKNFYKCHKVPHPAQQLKNQYNFQKEAKYGKLQKF
jgi:hypothetical protein